MTTIARLVEALRDIDLRIYIITCRAADMERTLATMLALKADTTAADEALRSTYQGLGVYRHRRAKLQHDLDELRGHL